MKVEPSEPGTVKICDALHRETKGPETNRPMSSEEIQTIFKERGIKVSENIDHISPPNRLVFAQSISAWGNYISIDRSPNGVTEILITNNVQNMAFVITDPEALKQIASLLYGAAIRMEDNKE